MMSERIKSLEELCTDCIGKNINYFSKYHENNPKIKFSTVVGEKLMIDYLMNSGKDGVDMKGLNFIFNHSFVKNLIIYPRKFKKINNLNFLNNCDLDLLKLYFHDNLNIDKKDNFKFSVKHLKINGSNDFSDFKNNQFFMNCFVTDCLDYFTEKSNDIYEVDLLSLIIEKSCENLKKVYIENANFNKSSFIKFLDEIKKKTNLEDVLFDFSIISNRKFYSIQTSLIRDALLPSANTLTSLFFGSDVCINWNYSQGNILFESLTCLKHLKFTFFINGETAINGSIEFFTVLKIFNSKTITYIYLEFYDINFYRQAFCQFLQSCRKLEKVFIAEKHYRTETNYHLVDSLRPSASKLKILNLENLKLMIRENCRSFKNLLLQTNLVVISIRNYMFDDRSFDEFIYGLKYSNNQLTSIYIDTCNLSDNNLTSLGRFFKNFPTLEHFTFYEDYFFEDSLNYLFHCLSACWKNLQTLMIKGNFEAVRYSRELIELIKRCINLKSIYLCLFNDSTNNIISLKNGLLKFRGIIEEIQLEFLMNDEKICQFIDFLKPCDNIRSLKIYRQAFTQNLLDKLIECIQNSKGTLKYLNIKIYNDCTIGNLLEFLDNCPNFESLHLKTDGYFNEIQPELNNYHFSISYDN